MTDVAGIVDGKGAAAVVQVAARGNREEGLGRGSGCFAGAWEFLRRIGRRREFQRVLEDRKGIASRLRTRSMLSIFVFWYVLAVSSSFDRGSSDRYRAERKVNLQDA